MKFTLLITKPPFTPTDKSLRCFPICALEAVKQDKLVWTQVSSLKGWKDPVTQLYSITAIPAIFVLDADNNIIASGLHGEELKNFVSGLFAEKGAK